MVLEPVLEASWIDIGFLSRLQLSSYYGRSRSVTQPLFPLITFQRSQGGAAPVGSFFSLSFASSAFFGFLAKGAVGAAIRIGGFGCPDLSVNPSILNSHYGFFLFCFGVDVYDYLCL